jgi:cell pole-organizing protein PopZ
MWIVKQKTNYLDMTIEEFYDKCEYKYGSKDNSTTSSEGSETGGFLMELTDDMRVDEKSEPPVETSVPEDMVLLSEDAVQVSTDKLNHLMNQVSASQGKPSEPQDVNSSLESLVLSLLRPYLKEWLNANLPTLVERLVQKEVERLVKNVKLS